MKTLKLILPIFAFVFAIAGALATQADNLILSPHGLEGSTCKSGSLNAPASNTTCQVSTDAQYPFCTVDLDGDPNAFDGANCGIAAFAIRQVPN